ncbi:MAG: DNA helicase RecG, partial [Fervidobacterium pennivorans]
MLLIEEFLDNCYEISREISEEVLNALIEYIEDNYEKIDDPLLSDVEIRVKLEEFRDYIIEAKKLSTQRALKRLSHVRGMVERFKYNFLTYSITCEDSDFAKPLDLPIKYAKGVGPAREKLLKKLGIETIGDLISFFPRDYEDRRKVIPLMYVRENEKITTKGVLKSVEKNKKGDLVIVSALLQDGI